MAATTINIKQYCATREGQRALEQFAETSDEWYLWSAYAAYRGAGLAIPEIILCWFDVRAREAHLRRIRRADKLI
jgi:hypothetical protein